MNDFPKIRWLQLAAGVLGMVAVTNLQYAWTFFVTPLQERFRWSKDDIQIAFTIFVAAETWLVPIEAWLADRFGTRKLLSAGGIMVGLSWYINAHATELWHIYAGNAIGGAGAGIVYGISIGSALRWFPDRRGLAAGITSAAFGAGSALTVIPIMRTIEHHGYQEAFLWFGLAQGGIVLLTAFVLRAPRSGELPEVVHAKVVQSTRDYHPLEMLKTPAFWTMYVLMTLVTIGGLLAIANLAPMAKSLGVADVPFVVLGSTIVALELASMIDRILNGATRPFFGWVSDHLGRENTMFVAFLLESVAILVWIQTAHNPVLFVIFSGLVFFAWGEIYSLFPALCGDMFGRRYATTNYGLLYTAKGVASIFVWVGAIIYERTGSWMAVFGFTVIFDWIVAFAILFVLKPMLRRTQENQKVALETAESNSQFLPPGADAPGSPKQMFD